MLRRQGRLGHLISYMEFFRSSGDFHWEQTSPMFSIHHILKGKWVRSGRKYEVKAGEAYAFFPGAHIIYHGLGISRWLILRFCYAKT